METESFCKTSCKRIDASVGGLVWVRRRNGSWWPGRILDPDELPETCLLSPRSGTPVKLLGREDASMDWYNLEKSRRVKAFRCGEYDECIEKAKAYATHSNRKGVKYARREEAILQALELESSRNEHQDHNSRIGNSTGTKYDSVSTQLHKISSPSQEHEFVARKLGSSESNSTPEFSQSVIMSEQTNHASASEICLMQNKRRKTPNDSEDDGAKGMKRMKGLQDLGLRVASNRKLNTSFPLEGSLEFPLPDSASLTEFNICNSLSTPSPITSSKGSCSSLKRRCSQVVYVHENLKRKDRRRPLTKVMESTTKVAVPGFCDQAVNPGQSSLEGVIEIKVSALESPVSKNTSSSKVVNNLSSSTGTSCEKETSFDASEHTCNAAVDANHSTWHQEDKDNAFSGVLESNDCSDPFLNAPFVKEKSETGGSPTVLLISASRKLQSDTAGKQSSHSNEEVSVTLNNEELDEAGSTNFTACHGHAELGKHRIEKHSSKRQLKGKWNSKCMSKSYCKSPDSSSADMFDQSDLTDGSLVGFGCKVDSNSLESLASDNCSLLAKSRLALKDHVDGSLLGNNKPSITKAHVAGPSDFPLNCLELDVGTREVVIQSLERRKIADNSYPYENLRIVRSTTLARNTESSFSGGMVVFNLPPQRPLSNLHSCLTSYGRERISDAPIVRTSEGSLLYDVNLDVQTSYQGQHVPLVSLMSRLNGKAIIGRPITVGVLEEGYCDILTNSASGTQNLYDVPIENSSEQLKDIDGPLLNDGSGNMIGTLQNKTGCAELPILEVQRNTSHRLTGRSSLSRKKLSKRRKSGSLSKKTRKLSSITVDRELKKEERKPVVDKLGEPVMACVPLKLVFSRINEGLSGLMRPACCIVTTKDT